MTLRVIPVPEAIKTMVAFFDTTSQAGEAVSEIVSQGVIPGAIEMMDNLTIQAAEKAVGAGFPTDVGAALIVELDGSAAECEACFDDVVAICERHGSLSIRIARDDADRAAIWRTRKAAFAAMGRIASNYYVQDGVIPRTKLPEVLARIAELADEQGMRVANVFHAGDGNLHPLVLYDGPHEAERAEELAGAIVEACVDAGGSITGEHGVGVDKKRYMPKHVRRARPRGVPDAALRLRPARPREPRQGHADAAAVRRGAGPLPPSPARARRHRGAVLRVQAVRCERPESAADAAELLHACAKDAVGGPDRGRRHEAVGPPGRGLRAAPGDRRARCDRRAQRGRPHRRAAAGRHAARARRGAERRRPDARARRRRSARATRRPSAARSPLPTPARCATATARRATSCSA